ncbi:MAG TPA: TonB-dependent receptor [Bacteroidota bacterium]|nr:TonB-dependent receptor [Bacteroidota bacterium]
MLTRFCTPIIAFLFLPLLAFSQGTDVRGVVTDSTTGERIPFANVILPGMNRGASTNLQGFFLIANAPQGRYQIKASSIGYETRTVTVDVFGPQAVVVNFQLASKPVEFSEVMVTDVAKRELTEIHTSVHVMEERDIRAVPTAAMEDIFRSIRILPGIVSTSDVNSQFYVRGGAGDQNLILLDGMKVYNPFHAFGIFSVFDPDIIKTTEVYTGAFPPEFGGRLSSVVNMTTRDGGSKAFDAKANINFLSSKVEIEGPAMTGLTYLFSGRKSLFSDTFRKFVNKDLPLSFYDAFLKATAQTGEAQGKYSFQAFLSGDNLRSPNATDPDYSWRTNDVGFVASGLIQDRVYVTATGFENTFIASRDSKGSTLITPASTAVHEGGVKANATLYTDSHELYFFGFEFSFPTLDYTVTNNYGVANTISSSYADASMWVRYQTAPSRLQADLGLFLDLGNLLSRSGGLEVFQPRVNFSYALWDTWKAKASYGRFSQNVITVNNEDDIISIFDAWIQVPQELKAEQADHYVLGFEGNPMPQLSTSFQAYYKYYSSLVTYNRDKVDALDPDYITGTGEAYGFEALTRYGTKLLDAYAAYTLGWTTITSSGFTYYPRYDRRHTINLLGVFHVADAFDVSLRWEVGSGFPFTQTIGYYDRLALQNLFRGSSIGETGKPYAILGSKDDARLPTYHRLDVSASYRFRLKPITGTFGVQIINLYNHKNVFYFDRKTGQEIDMLPFFPTATLSIEY